MPNPRQVLEETQRTNLRLNFLSKVNVEIQVFEAFQCAYMLCPSCILIGSAIMIGEASFVNTLQ